jgi:hypothetical protein
MHLDSYIGKSVLVNLQAAFLTQNKAQLTKISQASYDEYKEAGIYTTCSKSHRCG